jgi:hypothetical protein
LPLPALLSPTLPAKVMAVLDRIKKGNNPGRPAKSSAGGGGGGNGLFTERIYEDPNRMVMTIGYPRHLRNAPAVKSLAKAAAAYEERISGDVSQARKRPATTEASGDHHEPKRPRTADSSSAAGNPQQQQQQTPRIVVPSTPSKNTNTTRLTSITPQPQTPADIAVSMTPGESGSASVSTERPTTNGSSAHLANGTSGPLRAISSTPASGINYLELGRQLKHRRDRLGIHPVPKDLKEAACLSIECTIAYMYSFRRHHISLEPLVRLNANRMNDFTPFPALRPVMWTLQAVVTEWATVAHASSRDAAHVKLIPGLERARTNAWTRAHQEHLSALRDGGGGGGGSSADRSDLRMPLLGPWSRLEEAARESMRVLLRWAADENAPWSPEVDVNEIMAASPALVNY